MRRRRFIAPWHREEGLEASVLATMSPESLKVLAELKGKPALYHCVSRIVNRDFVLKIEEREEFVRLMRLYEGFSQVKVWTYCVMSNHFHILVEIPAPPVCGGGSWSDERLLDHLATIYGRRKMGQLRGELVRYRCQGNEQAADAFRERVFKRMWNVSEYMKIVKQCFTQWFNRKHERRGVLWEERFRSELVEIGHAARRVAAYVDLNPVRAGMVSDPKDYRWSGYGAAMGGVKSARGGILLAMAEYAATGMKARRRAVELSGWARVAAEYRMELYCVGEQCEGDRTKKRHGISRQRVAEVLARGGCLSESELVLCETRFLLDGGAIGFDRFINMLSEATRSFFGLKRCGGALRMNGVNSRLRTMINLRKDAIRPSCGS